MDREAGTPLSLILLVDTQVVDWAGNCMLDQRGAGIGSDFLFFLFSPFFGGDEVLSIIMIMFVDGMQRYMPRRCSNSSPCYPISWRLSKPHPAFS